MKFPGMKWYCLDCLDVLKEKPQVYRKTNKEHTVEPTMCEDCGIRPKWSTTSRTKYCQKCKERISADKIAERNKRAKARRKEGVKPTTKKPIDEKWMKRGL